MSGAQNRGAFILSWIHASPINSRFEEINLSNEVLHVLGAVFQVRRRAMSRNVILTGDGALDRGGRFATVY